MYAGETLPMSYSRYESIYFGAYTEKHTPILYFHGGYETHYKKSLLVNAKRGGKLQDIVYLYYSPML